MAILLWGILTILWIIMDPHTKRMAAQGSNARSVKAVMADLRYERRIKIIQEELNALKAGQYTALFLSMYPIRSYDINDLAYWRGLETFKAEMVMENGRELAGTLEYLQGLGEIPETVLLGLDPECLEEEYPLEASLLKLIRQTPETAWEILLATPSLNYWAEKAEEEWQTTLAGYEKAAELLACEENVKLYFAGDQEWLVCNGGNYAEEKMPLQDVAKTLLAYYTRDEYRLTEENRSDRMAATKELLEDWRRQDRTVEGMEGRALVFLGDSTFGNFTGSLAITGVVEEFTGARVWNCGYGGMAAAYGDPECPALGDLLEAIESGDGSSLGGDQEGPPAVLAVGKIKEIADTEEEVVVFLNFGINDYIKGFPIDNGDSHDSATYLGALRVAIEKLQVLFPKGRLVLVTPNFIKYNNYGTNPCGEDGNVLSDYVEGVRKLAEEYALPTLDFYEELGIDRENWAERLQDEIHPNEATRFHMGMKVLEQLELMR